jgi:hypothetical protein
VSCIPSIKFGNLLFAISCADAELRFPAKRARGARQRSVIWPLAADPRCQLKPTVSEAIRTNDHRILAALEAFAKRLIQPQRVASVL